jgi:hypothetical protein
MRRFFFAERSIICSKMMPNGMNSTGLNDTHSLRLIPSLSADRGVTKYEIPILKESRSYTLTKYETGSVVRPHNHDEG